MFELVELLRGITELLRILIELENSLFVSN